MKIVVTGASGFVGQQLVPLLSQSGAELLLVGREPSRLATLFPGHKVCDYAEMMEQGRRFDLLLHLAVVNNNVDATADVFYEVNVRQMLEIRDRAEKVEIGKFINVSSIHALDDSNNSLYAASKRAGVEALRSAEEGSLTLYLPAITGNNLAGKLAFLNRLPAPLFDPALAIVATLRPTLTVEKLSKYVVTRAALETDTEVVLSEGQGANRFYHLAKRITDLSFALAVVVFLWWLMLIVWVAIKLQSPGPGLFAQPRVGKNGKLFTCYKFRTMKLGTAQAATNEISANAVTTLGHFLRRTKVDELRQVWNIFRNELSLVGPRPCLPVQGELVEARRRRGVWNLKPGITGLAQVNGIDMSEPERLGRWDQRYGALQSLLLDLKIILATARGRGQGDKVAK